MKAFAVVNPGLEHTAAAEIKELTSATNFTIARGILTFNIKNYKDFCALAYRAQSLSRICYLISEFAVDNSLTVTMNDLKKQIAGFKVSDWTAKSFVVDCQRSGNHDFSSHDFATSANTLISKLSNTTSDFKTPQLKFYCCIYENKGYFGIDVAGFDLSKREYRIFGHASDVKATVAYFLVRLSGFKKGLLLDPFTRSGAIAIEAALFASNFPVNFYRKDAFSFLKLKPFASIDFKKFFTSIDKKLNTYNKQVFNYSPSIAHLRSAEKNAKIAGVNKTIKFSRVDIEWLELKFDKGTVNCIVSFPPQASKSTNLSELKKLYSEFFYQAAFILSKNGKIVLAALSEDAFLEAAIKNKFKLLNKSEFWMGTDAKLALIFTRS